jgi:hypothetical protein
MFAARPEITTLLVCGSRKLMKTSCFQLAIRRPALVLLAILTYGALAPRPSQAKGVLLDFEGIGDNVAIQDFYNGGAAGNGVIGPDYDVTFAGSALSLVDADDGGGGNFANEPSSKSIMFWLNDVDTHMNFAPGFSQFSLYYSTGAPGSLSFWTGPDGTGSPVGPVQPLGVNGHGCGGDPTGYFDCWTKVAVALPGVAYSATFTGTANVIGFDNVSFNPQEISVPGPLPIVGVAAAFGASRRIRRRLQIGSPK